MPSGASQAGSLKGHNMIAVLRHLAQAMLRFYAANQLPALFGLLLVEEAGLPLPLPGDTLIALAGAQHHGSPWFALIVIAVSSAAVFCGSSVLYMLMRRGGRPWLEKYGKFLHLSQARLDRMERWFIRRGPIAIVIGRLIPGLRIPTTVMAGLAGVPYRVFVPATLTAAVIWSTLYYFAGVLLERSLGVITTGIAGLLDSVTDWVLLISTLVILSVLSIVSWRQRRQQAAKPPNRTRHPDLVA